MDNNVTSTDTNIEDIMPTQDDYFSITDIIGKERVNMIISGGEIGEIPLGLTEMTESGLLKETIQLDEEVRERMKDEVKTAKDYCLTCGTTGETLPDDVTECPECHRVFTLRARKLRAEQEEFPSSIFVPERYKGSTWNRDSALEGKELKTLKVAMKRGDNPLPTWVNGLEDFLSKNNGMRLENKGSCFISAPNGFGKRHFAYTLIKELYKNKITSSPILLLNDVQTSDDKLMEIPYLILYSTRYYFQENVDKLDYILNKRKLLDKPTLILSEVAEANYISRIDKQKLKFDITYDIYSMK